MSTSHRLARSMAVAIPAILLVATAAFAHSANFGAAPAGTWTDKPDITNVGVVGDHEDVWEDADNGDSDRDEIDDQVGDDNDGAEVEDANEVEEPDAAEHHAQHATPAEPKVEAGDENDDDQGEDNDDQDEAGDHDGSHDGGDDSSDDGSDDGSDGGEHDD